MNPSFKTCISPYRTNTVNRKFLGTVNYMVYAILRTDLIFQARTDTEFLISKKKIVQTKKSL